MQPVEFWIAVAYRIVKLVVHMQRESTPAIAFRVDRSIRQFASMLTGLHAAIGAAMENLQASTTTTTLLQHRQCIALVIVL